MIEKGEIFIAGKSDLLLYMMLENLLIFSLRIRVLFIQT